MYQTNKSMASESNIGVNIYDDGDAEPNINDYMGYDYSGEFIVGDCCVDVTEFGGTATYGFRQWTGCQCSCRDSRLKWINGSERLVVFDTTDSYCHSCYKSYEEHKEALGEAPKQVWAEPCFSITREDFESNCVPWLLSHQDAEKHLKKLDISDGGGLMTFTLKSEDDCKDDDTDADWKDGKEREDIDQHDDKDADKNYKEDKAVCDYIEKYCFLKQLEHYFEENDDDEIFWDVILWDVVYPTTG